MYRWRGFSRIQCTPCPYKLVKCEVVTSVQGCLAVTTTHSLSVTGVGGTEGIPACLVRAYLGIGAWEALHKYQDIKITENCINQGNKRRMLRNETFVGGVSLEPSGTHGYFPDRSTRADPSWVSEPSIVSFLWLLSSSHGGGFI